MVDGLEFSVTDRKPFRVRAECHGKKFYFFECDFHDTVEDLAFGLGYLSQHDVRVLHAALTEALKEADQ